jgi:hypothetical protein
MQTRLLVSISSQIKILVSIDAWFHVADLDLDPDQDRGLDPDLDPSLGP